MPIYQPELSFTKSIFMCSKPNNPKMQPSSNYNMTYNF
uniref:Uncharacterized protein n=1 Tax=Rhizophora mucronata TaxID=61149 RepID=A0A2P2MTM9_RHIMU